MDNARAIASYPVIVTALPKDLGGGYEASFAPLARSVVGHGETAQAAIGELLEGVPGFLELMAEKGQTLPVPQPRSDWSDFSGKFNVRVPKVLHAKLVRLADDQGVSLNSLVQTVLTAGVTALEAGHEFGVRPGPAARRRSTSDANSPAASIIQSRQPGLDGGA